MKILLFGITKDIIGSGQLDLSLPAGMETVGELRQFLKEQYKGLAALRSLAIAVDSEYAEDGMKLSPSAEIALIPPVSGG
ncbi:molybdopterin converting factor subunit 1 [Arcticibacter sp. MXS-1]|uniref:molybdopterin converting factor subunit 1 n=1 Tax=Arcticibacter sp. MXS-1 TaxID=3341726 RepID=UPI0035A84EFB